MKNKAAMEPEELICEIGRRFPSLSRLSPATRQRPGFVSAEPGRSIFRGNAHSLLCQSGRSVGQKAKGAGRKNFEPLQAVQTVFLPE